MTLGLLITFFMGVVVVVALISPIAKDVEYMTEKFTIINESHSYLGAIDDGNVTNPTHILNLTNAYATGDWRISGCPMTSFSMIQANGTTLASTTDYVVNLRTGRYNLEPSALINASILGDENHTNSTYTFCGEGYIPGTGGRAMANLILLFAALGLLGFAIWHVLRNQFT